MVHVGVYMMYIYSITNLSLGCLAGAVLTHSPLTAATWRRHVRWSCGHQVRQVGFPRHSGFLPQEDHLNANIGANEQD